MDIADTDTNARDFIGASAIELRAVASLTHDVQNPRTHPKAQLEGLRASLKEFGFLLPALITGEGVILAGNGMVEAARLEGWTEVPCVVADHLSQAKQRAAVIALNKLYEQGGWNKQRLAQQLPSLAGAGFNLKALGFKANELAKLLPKSATIGATATEALRAPDVPANPVTCPGDIWLLGDHRILCGDSTQPDHFARLLAGDQVDVTLTDPPYCSGGFQEAGKKAGSVGTRSKAKVANDTLSTRGYMVLLKSALPLTGAPLIYCFTDWRMWNTLFDVVESCGWGVRNMVVWDKESPGMGNGWRMQHELVMVGVKGDNPFAHDVAQGNVIRCKRSGNEHHLTEKPVSLLEDILKPAPHARVVCDPFVGSGSTIIAAERLGLACRGMELTTAYCDVAVRRWQDETGREATRAADGTTYNELRKNAA